MLHHELLLLLLLLWFLLLPLLFLMLRLPLQLLAAARCAAVVGCAPWPAAAGTGPTEGQRCC